METVPIESNYGFYRDLRTHAVININTAEYDSYLLRKKRADSQTAEVTAIKDELTQLKALVQQLAKQLLDKDKNDSVTQIK